MTRLIDADALKPEMCKACHICDVFGKCSCEDQELVDAQPTVDAVPVRHGKWIDEGQYADFFPHHAWRCSECGEHVIEIDIPWYKYCPNCGAKMDAERKEE